MLKINIYSFIYRYNRSTSFRSSPLIISFSSVKGGVSKTTSCCNLGYFFAKKDKRTLVVDFDSQGGATHHLSSKFNKKFKASITDVLIDKCKIDQAIHSYNKNLDIIPISFTFHEIASTNFSESLVASLKTIMDKYDYIFFDLAPSIYPGSIIPLGLSDYTIIPVDCSGGLSLLGLKSEEKILEQVKQKNKSQVKILGILPCFVERTKISADVIKFLHENYKEFILPNVRCSTQIAQASSLGKSIFEYRPSSNGAKDYAIVGEELLKRLKKKGE